MALTAVLRTLGCRLNQAETDEILLALADRGVEIGGARPDIVVVNTCTVTAEASSASRKLIRRSVRDFPQAKVVVTGCYAVDRSAEVAEMDGVSLVIPVKDDLAERVATRVTGGSSGTVRFASPRRNLKVQTGCDERCTFCIVPRTRGALQSRDRVEILNRARRLVDSGVRELTLTGVHLGKYGVDQGRSGGLHSVLEDLLTLNGLERIRLSSIEASQIDEDLLDLLAAEPKLCRQLHLPLQTGDPELWQKMRRPGTLGRFLEVAQIARSKIPGIALSTDVMVGFPGEDEAAFAATMEVVEDVGFEKLHVFRYSPRAGTPAAADPNQIDPVTKRERSRVLRKLGSDIRDRWLATQVGHIGTVLVEKATPHATGAVLTGYTDTYAPVRFSGPIRLVGRVVDVLVASASSGTLEGDLVGLPLLQDR